MIRKQDGKYYINDREAGLDDLLPLVMEADDASTETVVLTEGQNAALHELYSAYNGIPDFTNVSLREASSDLFAYLAESRDEALAATVAASMGWKTHDEQLEDIRKGGQESASYRAYWMTLAEEVLSCEGFDDYRFGSVKRGGSGTYLYDGEKAVCYIEVSREGGDERSAVISLTLLGNPEAVEDEEGNRSFEWCCFFDDEISKSDDDARILGGVLRTIDPYGANSRLHRRYDIVYEAIDAVTLATVTRSLVRMLESYPPQV